MLVFRISRRHLLTGAAAVALALPTAAFAQPTFSTTGQAEAIVRPAGMQDLDFIQLLADAPSIELGAEVVSELGGAVQAAAFVFEGAAGDRVTISLSSEGFDTYLVLVDAQGAELAVDDDGGAGLNSMITGFELPADGTYGVIATSFGGYRGTGTAEGEFTLSVAGFEVQRIEYSQRVEGELTAEALTQEYVFTGTAGDSVSIFMGSEEFDTFLFLYDAAGNEIASNDDGGGNLDSLIGPFMLPETGEYTIQANSFSRSATGFYFLTLDRVEMVEAVYGEPLEVVFAANDSVFITFAAELTDVVNVVVDAEIDTTLNLRDTFGFNIHTDEDSGSRFNPEISEYVINTAGAYTLVLTRAPGETRTGTAEVTIERGELLSLDEGVEQTVIFTEEVTTRSLNLTVEAGQAYTLTFASETAVAVSPSFDVRFGEFSSSYFSSSNVIDGSFTFIADGSGTALITINDYTFGGSALTVQVTAGE